jgi:hypothetical protein
MVRIFKKFTVWVFCDEKNSDFATCDFAFSASSLVVLNFLILLPLLAFLPDRPQGQNGRIVARGDPCAGYMFPHFFVFFVR